MCCKEARFHVGRTLGSSHSRVRRTLWFRRAKEYSRGKITVPQRYCMRVARTYDLYRNESIASNGRTGSREKVNSSNTRVSFLSATFNDLLLRFSQELGQEERNQIERELWDAYGASLAVLVVDMSGFTRIAKQHGVVHYLSMVRRMQLTARPVIESYDGHVVKFEADNAFAKFDQPGNAIRACIALNLAMSSANILTPSELDVHVSCGIDFGKCLVPHEADYFGGPVNRASKLGEDLGEPGQILVTDEAMAFVPASLNIQTEPLTVNLAEEALSVHSVNYQRTSTS